MKVENIGAALLPPREGLSLLGLRALEGERVAVLDAALVEVVVAGREAGVLEADGKVLSFLTLALPRGTDFEIAAKNLEGGSIFVGPVENPVKVGLYFKGEGIDLARVAVVRRFEKADVVSHDISPLIVRPHHA